MSNHYKSSCCKAGCVITDIKNNIGICLACGNECDLVVEEDKEEEKVRWPSKKKYPCKKLKGEHDFELDILYRPLSYSLTNKVEKFFGKAYYEYRCSGCGKKLVKDKPLGVLKTTDNYKEI